MWSMSMLPFARVGAMTTCWCLLKVSKLKTPQQHKVCDSHSIHFYTLCIVYALYFLPLVLYELLVSFCFFFAGLIFWKNPRRKLYAVSKADLKSGDSKKRALIVDSNEEDVEPIKKPKVEEKLSLVLEELATIKDSLDEVTSLTKDTRISLGLKRAIRDTFKCLICHRVPIVPPVIVTKCCKTILGCSTCVNTWYSGEDALTKTCPACRSERGYNETMLLRSLDGFLKDVREAIQVEEEEDPHQH